MSKTASEKRWWYLAAGTIVLLFSGLIYGWSLFSGYFREIYPDWGMSELSLTFTISMISFVAGGLISGTMVKKLSAGWILRIAGLLTLAGFSGLSLLDPSQPGRSLLMLYICYGLIASLGVGINFNVVLSTVGRWFPDRIGFSSGTMMMGFGCGALILGGITTVIIDRVGLFRAFLILGILMAIAGLISSLIIKAPDAAGRDDSGDLPLSPNDVSTGEMLRSKVFIVFMIWAITVNVAGMLVIGSAANIAVFAGAPAIVGMVVSICNGLGRIAIGALFDVVGRVRTMGFNLTLLLAAGILLTLGAVRSSALLIIGGLIVMGVEYGGNPTICSSFAREEFGERYYSTNFAVINTSVVPAAIIGPTLSGRLVEMSGGSYLSSFIVIVVCGVLGMALFALLNRISKH